MLLFLVGKVPSFWSRYINVSEPYVVRIFSVLNSGLFREL